MRSVLVVAIVTISFQVQSATKDQIYSQVCSYDPAFCQKLRNQDGSYVTPEPTQSGLIRRHAKYMQEVAKRYEVPAEAIFGAILTENTLNVGMKDDVQKFVARFGITGIGSKQFSFGMGQINMPAALSAERVLASIDGRPVRSEDEVRRLLLTPEGAIEYAAGILREASDAYREQGMDISKNVPQLITLYNLGDYKNRARETKRAGKEPKMNYFGAFYAINEDFFKEEFQKGLSEKRETVKIGQTGKLKDQSLQLLASPPYCNTKGSKGLGKDYEAVLSRKPAQTSPLVGEYFKPLARTLDCDGKEWVLVDNFGQNYWNGGSRKLGWLPADKLDATSKPAAERGMKCEPGNQTCRDEVLSAYGEKSYLGTDSAREISFLPLKTFKDDVKDDKGNVIIPGAGDKKADWAKFNSMCLSGDLRTYGRMGNGSGKNIHSPKDDEANRLSLDEVRDILAKVKKAKEQITSVYKLSSWNDPANPFRNNFYHLDQFETCTQTSVACYTAQREEIEAALKIDYSKITTLAEYYQATQKMSSFYLEAIQPHSGPSPQEEFEETERVCKVAAQGLAKSTAEFKEAFDNIRKSVAEFMKKGSRGTLERVKKGCNDMRKIQTYYAWGEKTWSDGERCSLNFTTTVSQGGMGSYRSQMYFTFQMATALRVSSAELDDMLNDSLNHEIAQMKAFGKPPVQSVFNDMYDCAYNPLETIKSIEKLLRNPCVEAVMVSDPDLKSAIQFNSEKVVSFPLEETDRFAVRFKQSCKMEKK